MDSGAPILVFGIAKSTFRYTDLDFRYSEKRFRSSDFDFRYSEKRFRNHRNANHTHGKTKRWPLQQQYGSFSDDGCAVNKAGKIRISCTVTRSIIESSSYLTITE